MHRVFRQDLMQISIEEYFVNILLQKVLALVPLTATGPEVFVTNMTTFLSDSYYALEETLTHMDSLKLKRYPGENVTDCCA